MTALGRSNGKEWRAARAIALLLSWGFVGCAPPSDQPPDPIPVPVTGVSLDRSALSLAVGGSATTLVATLSPANATNTTVLWSSNNPVVATVSDIGVVTPGAAGFATITATTKDGAKTATCAVTVTSNAIAVTGITLDRATLDLVTGAPPVKLIATLTPATATNKKVLWQSTDVTVATVSDSGSVTPLSPGTTTIVAKTANGAKATSCVVTVTRGPVAVSGVTLDKGTLKLTIGSIAPALVATVAPANATDKATSWSSDKPDVATVSAGGVITAKAAGTAIITVTTHEGPFIASCTVTVTKPSNAVTGMTLAPKSFDLVVGRGGASLTAAVAPANADNPAVTWTSSDQKVVTVSSTGLLTPVGSGTASVTASTMEGAFADTCTVTVHSDPVTSLASTTPLTGQIVLTWRDPLDLNAEGVRVMVLTTSGPIPHIFPIGTRKAAFAGLTVGTAQTFSVRTLGTAGSTSEPVAVENTPVQVVKVLRQNGGTMILTDTFGSSQTETHDLVIANSAEIGTAAGFPKNYRWVLMPGLTDPSDPSLVSFKSETYSAETSRWVETERYLHIHPGGVTDSGQFYNWCTSTPPVIAHVAYADPIDGADKAFKTDATFKMVSRTAPVGATSFQWLGDSSGNSYLIDDCYHLVAQDAPTILQDKTRPATAFDDASAWFVEDVKAYTP